MKQNIKKLAELRYEDLTPYQKVVAKLVEQEYISQKEVLDMFSEAIPRDEVLQFIMGMEQEGLVFADRRKEVVYYLADIVRH